jgi:hypothetical protein
MNQDQAKAAMRRADGRCRRGMKDSVVVKVTMPQAVADLLDGAGAQDVRKALDAALRQAKGGRLTRKYHIPKALLDQAMGIYGLEGGPSICAALTEYALQLAACANTPASP